VRIELVQLPRLSDTTVSYEHRLAPWLSHSVFAWLGFRPVLAQHTRAEHLAIKRWAANRRSLAEIGVAEGVSALGIRESMADNATLYLVDPFHLSRVPALNFTRRAAHRAISSHPRGDVVWINKFSQDAVADFDAALDFLMIDGDHSESGVERDWNDWSRFVVPGGVVLFHDARLFEGGWTTPDYGPVRLANRLFRRDAIAEWEIVEEVHSLVIVQRKGADGNP
jgi:predicted O-methyltransferase YrrM